MSRDSDRHGPEQPPADEPAPAVAPQAAAAPRDPLGLDDEDDPAGAAPSKTVASGGRLLAGLALLLALGALGGAGYLYYQLIYLPRDVADATEARLAAVGDELAALQSRFGELSAAQERARSEAIAELRAQQAEARRETERMLREAVAEVARQAPPDSGEWRRAEVQYLLRIANHRLLMERDVAGALRLLRAADSVLAELDDFGLHEVRARLADEIAALENVQGTDLQGLFLRLEAAKAELDELPLRKPRFTAEDPAGDAAAASGEGGFWATLEAELGELVRVRELDGEVKPLLAPEEAVYLELNLRLMLERAQLAAVRGEQLLYEESLNTALDWIDRYLNVDEPAVAQLRRELLALVGLDLERPVPDISGSLNALQNAMRSAP